MKKTLTIAALIALLAVPFMAVSATETYKMNVCHKDGQSGNYELLSVSVRGVEGGPGVPQGHGGHVDDSWAAQDNEGKDYDVQAQSDFPGRCAPEPEYELCSEVFRLDNTFDFSPWSEYVWDADRGLFVSTRTKTVTKTWVDKRDREHVCREVQVDYPEERTQEPELFVGCAGWRVFRGDVRVAIGFWTLPFVLESAESDFWEGTITEPKKCLQVPGEPTATPEPEPTATPVPGDCSIDGDGICPGDDDDPEEHPSTGGEIDAGLAVVTALSGLALAGIGGSILYMKRRASR